MIAVANQKGGDDKSTSVYCIGSGLAQDGNKVLLLDVDPQGDLTKMLGERKPHELPMTLSNVMNDIVAGQGSTEHPERRACCRVIWKYWACRTPAAAPSLPL